MKVLLAGLLLGVVLAAPVYASAQDVNFDDKSNAKEAAWHETPREVLQDYQPDPAVWLVRDDDTRIYLLGTVHVLPEGFRWRSPRLDAIVAEADELIVEASEDAVDADRQEAMIASLTASFAKRPSVSARLSPANRPKWLALAMGLGMPPEEFDHLPPVLALFGIAASRARAATGAELAFGVETVLEAEFRAAGKPIGAIESPVDVLSSLLSIDESVLIKELDADLSRFHGKTIAAMFSPVPLDTKNTGPQQSWLAADHAWAQGQEIDIRDELLGKSKFSQTVGTRLLDDRNRAWAGWLRRRLDMPGTVLVAVGAGHLGGKRSVQVMLSERGLTAERLN